MIRSRCSPRGSISNLASNRSAEADEPCPAASVIASRAELQVVPIRANAQLTDGTIKWPCQGSWGVGHPCPPTVSGMPQ